MIDKHIGKIAVRQQHTSTQHVGVIRASAVLSGNAEHGTKIYGEEYVRALEYAVRDYAPTKEADKLLGTIASPRLEDRLKIRDLELEVQRLRQSLDAEDWNTTTQLCAETAKAKAYLALAVSNDRERKALEEALLWVREQIETAWKACPDDGLEWLVLTTGLNGLPTFVKS